MFESKTTSVVNDLLGRLLWEKDSVDVWQDTSRSNGDTSQELVQLLVILDCKRDQGKQSVICESLVRADIQLTSQGDVARNDTALLVITSGVSSELKDLGTEVLEDGGKVDRSSGTHTSGVLALTKVTTDTTDRELEARLGGSGGRLLLSTTSLSFSSFSGHGCLMEVVDLRKRRKNRSESFL
jgi:hypothetical protein